MSVNEVYNSLIHLKQTSARGLDGLDAKILKLSAPVIAESLTYIYNLCISKNQFPKAFKAARVIPIFKSGDRSYPVNYRPISILSTVSKPLENHINKNILKHFNHFDLFHPNQSGFRANHSCHTALTNLVDQWISNINNNKITGVLIVDFAKAFDVIDHSLLLRKLKIYGFSSSALMLISSFLSERKQVVSADGFNSNLSPVNYGVPQGSVLGPILFCIYINDLPLSVNTLCEMFADDTTLHSSDHKVSKISSVLQESLDQLLEWSELNHMSLHPKKTKYLIVTTRQKRQNLSDNSTSLFINGAKIEEVDQHKILGVVIDNNLSWSSHISMICNILSKKVFQLSKIKHFLNLNCRRSFFNAYVESYINYASTVWDSASEKTLKPLQSLYRRAIKLIILKSSSLTVSDYKNLNILPIKMKLKFNKALFMFKIMSGFAPPSLRGKFVTNSNRHIQRVIVPLPRIDLFKTSFTYSGGCLWNELLSSLKVDEIKSLPSFKKTYHSYLMKNLTFL